MAGRKEHDGSIFRRPTTTKDDPAATFEHLRNAPPSPRRDDAAAWADVILTELAEWESSWRRREATEAIVATAEDLRRECRRVKRDAASGGVRHPNGLTTKVTAASLIELGYLWCQFRVMAFGFERLASFGKDTERNLSKGKRSKPITDEARRLLDDGAPIRRIAKLTGETKATVERWRKEWKAEKKL